MSDSARRDTTPGTTAVAGEATLVEALRRGDPAALLALVERHERRIYNFAARMCRHPEDARDVLQETFLAAVRASREFRGESALQTWLFRIAANACRKMKRRRKFEPRRELSLEEFLPSGEEATSATRPDGEDSPEAVLARADLRAALDAGIAELPSPYRAVLILRDLEGLSTEETAAALGLEPGAVRTRLHRARLFLRQRLTGHAPR
jgi:RNA polymerase sigma-70 factor (ECF subfamily)